MASLGELEEGETPPFTGVTQAWRKKHVLSPARIQVFRGDLVDLDSVMVREQIAHRHPGFLRDHGVGFLDRGVIQSPDRSFTQRLSRRLYEEGAAGLLFPSKLAGTCAVLFERRARLVPAGRTESLLGPIPELEQACSDLQLSVEPIARGS